LLVCYLAQRWQSDNVGSLRDAESTNVFDARREQHACLGIDPQKRLSDREIALDMSEAHPVMRVEEIARR
jgi:hypothetical protein